MAKLSHARVDDDVRLGRLAVEALGGDVVRSHTEVGALFGRSRAWAWYAETDALRKFGARLRALGARAACQLEEP